MGLFTLRFVTWAFSFSISLFIAWPTIASRDLYRFSQVLLRSLNIILVMQVLRLEQQFYDIRALTSILYAEKVCTASCAQVAFWSFPRDVILDLHAAFPTKACIIEKPELPHWIHHSRCNLPMRQQLLTRSSLVKPLLQSPPLPHPFIDKWSSNFPISFYIRPVDHLCLHESCPLSVSQSMFCTSFTQNLFTPTLRSQKNKQTISLQMQMTRRAKWRKNPFQKEVKKAYHGDHSTWSKILESTRVPPRVGDTPILFLFTFNTKACSECSWSNQCC